MFTRSHLRWIAVLLVVCVILLPLLSFGGSRPSTGYRGFHYLVPTTATNAEVCKLLLSGSIMNWPDPVFLGWEGRGRWNGTKSHLFKLSESVRYLETLPPSQSDDLVLILDAFDVWLQLPPQIMIERYLHAIDKQNQRLKSQGIWRSWAGRERVQNTVLLGADKYCWPRHGDKPLCWSAPESTMPPDVFGPDTDTRDFSIRPRYANSGTIMGPVKDVRDLLKAALWKIDNEWESGFWAKTSDQHYLGNVWGEQEAARIRLWGGEKAVTALKKMEVFGKRSEVVSARGETLTQEDGRTEFHMALDQESDAFQIHNFYTRYVTWMTFNHSTVSPESAPRAKTYPAPRLDQLTLDPSFDTLPGPFAAGIEEDNLPTHLTWKDIMLGVNSLTGNVFPLYHVTGEKWVRGWWWPRMWFHPYGETLLKAARRQRVGRLTETEVHVVARVGGTTYAAVEAHNGDAAQNARAKDAANTKGGAWNDLGEYMPWNGICEAYEKDVFIPGVVI